MAHPDLSDHGPTLTLAPSEVGAVSVCSCGVITLTLHYLSLRFEPGAFGELQGLLLSAQRRLDGEGAPALMLPAPGDAPPVH